MVNPPFIEEEGIVTCAQFWFNELGISEPPETVDMIKQKIEQDHKIGYQAGGSGHMAHVSYDLISLKELTEYPDQSKLVLYGYRQFVESEFNTSEYMKVVILLLDQANEKQAEKNLVTVRTDTPDELGFN